MGDLMHALPALTDASEQYSGVEFDWVVDEAFAEVPSWHHAVKNIYTSAHRRWKKNFRSSWKKREFSRFWNDLNINEYDVIIDAQNNVKSAFISLLRKGHVHGMDSASVAEQPAFIAYKYRHFIEKNQHAIARQRELFANALGYKIPDTAVNYGIKLDAFKCPTLPFESPFLFLVHNASWTTKLWPEKFWFELIGLAKEENYNVVLPGGNSEELARAEQIASKHDNAYALPRMSLSELGGIISKADGAVCCDTGLAHLTAITGTPSVTMYGPTSVELIGTHGSGQQHLDAENPNFSCSHCYKRSCKFHGQASAMSACMDSFQPVKVWEILCNQMKKAAG